MPAIGTISRGVDVGRPSYGLHKMIWHACCGCGAERWVQFKSGGPIRDRCHPCSSAAAKKARLAADPAPGLRICRECEVTKSHAEFPTRGRTIRGRCQACRTAAAGRARNDDPETYRRRSGAYRKAKPHVARGAYLKYKYGITLDEYEQMLAAQGGKCWICHGIDSVRLSVDHCHETGEVRGLLCGNCNRLIGYAKEDEEVLARAILYVRQFCAPRKAAA